MDKQGLCLWKALPQWNLHSQGIHWTQRARVYPGVVANTHFYNKVTDEFLIAKNGVSLLLACLATGHHWNRCRLEGTQSFLCLESHQSHVISSRLLSFTMSAPKGCIKHLFLPVLPVSLGDLAQASSFNYVYNAARSQPAPPSSWPSSVPGIQLPTSPVLCLLQ